MSRKGQRAPQLYQEGSYVKRRGRTVNIGKSYQPANTAAYQPPPIPEPPPVPHRHYGDQEDLGPDRIYDLDPQLPTEEEVRRSYGKVMVIVVKLLNLSQLLTDAT
jgi:hypothetical protein